MDVGSVLFGLFIAAGIALAAYIIYRKMTEDGGSYASTINYEPRGDRVIVQRMERPAPDPNGNEIIIPGSMQKPLNEGVVVAVGPGLRNRFTGEIDPVELEPGDRVSFLDYAGFDIEVDGVRYLSMRDEEIHGRRGNDEPKTRTVEMWTDAATAQHAIGDAAKVTLYASKEDLNDARTEAEAQHPDYAATPVTVIVRE